MYHFDIAGICGNARLADVGGPGFLLPLPQLNKVIISCYIGEVVCLKRIAFSISHQIKFLEFF